MVNSAIKKLITRTFFSWEVQASLIMNHIFWKVLYFDTGFFWNMIFPSFLFWWFWNQKRFLIWFYQKKYPRIKPGMNCMFWGMNYNWGSKISVVKAPSSLFRLIYPSERFTISSIRISPKPWPSPFVLLKRFPCFFSFFPAVKLVKEMYNWVFFMSI